MRSIKGILVIIIWSICFFLTSIFLLIEYVMSFLKFKLTSVKSERYFKPRPIFPYEESKKVKSSIKS